MNVTLCYAWSYIYIHVVFVKFTYFLILFNYVFFFFHFVGRGWSSLLTLQMLKRKLNKIKNWRTGIENDMRRDAYVLNEFIWIFLLFLHTGIMRYINRKWHFLMPWSFLHLLASRKIGHVHRYFIMLIIWSPFFFSRSCNLQVIQGYQTQEFM